MTTSLFKSWWHGNIKHWKKFIVASYPSFRRLLRTVHIKQTRVKKSLVNVIIFLMIPSLKSNCFRKKIVVNTLALLEITKFFNFSFWIKTLLVINPVVKSKLYWHSLNLRPNSCWALKFGNSLLMLSRAQPML